MLDPDSWDFSTLTNFYHKTNLICLSNYLGVKYSFRNNSLSNILCNKFHCDRCRQKLISRLKPKIEKYLGEKHLYNHIVITTEGNEKYRDHHTYIESYRDMMYVWNIIRTVLSYRAKKKGFNLSYILLNRSQKNGYCHLHIITNYHVKKKELRSILAKHKNTGFCEVTKHEKTANYLTNDFRKDHEWIIPFGIRHYTCSRDIDLNIDLNDDPEDPKLHIPLDPNKKQKPVDQVYDAINKKYGYPPPFDYLLSKFVEINLESECGYPKALSGLYIDGEFVCNVKGVKDFI